MASARALEKSAVLITGGTSGVGLAAALRFAALGVPQIAIVGRDAARGEKARAAVQGLRTGTDVVFIAGDAHVASEATRIVEVTQARFERVDVLVNSTVGPYPPALLHNIPIEASSQC
jgi:2-hydroxycyclohexanecarboxyl-CoA dehydrogenase